jgi:aspartyl-tRNA(Asn)/glutamyl-tRNA(Gln) amidotransferase subunit A
MSGDDLCFLTIAEASKRIAKRELSPVDLTRAFLQRIDTVDKDLRAFRNLLAERALMEASEAEKEIAAGNYKGPLHGIPLAHKEAFDVQGQPNPGRAWDPKAGAPAEDASPIRRLKQAGAIMLGSLAMGGGEANAPRNPWNTNHITGGSSSGSGAAVAAGLCMGSVGEDTAGSIRRPASLCGIVGLKATFGRVSRAGLAPLTWSFDHAGPLTWTVEDAALMLQQLAGYDPEDPTSVTEPIPNYSAALDPDPSKLTVGVPRAFWDDPRHGADPENLAAVERAMELLTSAGARVKEVSIPSLEYGAIANTIIFYSEGLALRQREFEAHPEWLTEGTRGTSLYLGSLTGGADYTRALLLRSRLTRELHETLRDVDVIAAPAQVAPAPTFDEYGETDSVTRQIQNYDAAFNLVGFPAISVPCGFSSRGMPIGLQLAAGPWDESGVLRAAYVYEQQARWFEKRPPV